MFCPQCGQQQISGEMRFCSRCGFPLGGVIQLLASGGMAATTAGDTGASLKQLSPRRRGYRQGGLMLLIGMIATPLMGILTEVGFPELLVGLTAILFFWGGIIRMIYARFFEDKGVHAAHDIPPAYIPPTTPAQFSAGGAPQSALPPHRSVPVSNWRQPTNTAEIIPPASVTENTTRLLDDKAEPPKR